MFSSPAFQVRCSLYSATGKSVWKHPSSRDVGWEEDQEEKVNSAPEWDGCEGGGEGDAEGQGSGPMSTHSPWVSLLLRLSQLHHPGLRPGRPILLVALSFQSWLCFGCSPMEELLLVLLPVVPGPMARDGSCSTEMLAVAFLLPPSLLPLQSGSPTVHHNPVSSFWCLGFLPWHSMYTDSSLLDLRHQNVLFPPPKCSHSNTCHSPTCRLVTVVTGDKLIFHVNVC